MPSQKVNSALLQYLTIMWMPPAYCCELLVYVVWFLVVCSSCQHVHLANNLPDWCHMCRSCPEACELHLPPSQSGHGPLCRTAGPAGWSGLCQSTPGSEQRYTQDVPQGEMHATYKAGPTAAEYGIDSLHHVTLSTITGPVQVHSKLAIATVSSTLIDSTVPCCCAAYRRSARLLSATLIRINPLICHWSQSSMCCESKQQQQQQHTRPTQRQQQQQRVSSLSVWAMPV